MAAFTRCLTLSQLSSASLSIRAESVAFRTFNAVRSNMVSFAKEWLGCPAPS